MARAIWSGSISFGLVNIPVKLYTAVRSDDVHFHMLHDKDHVRLRRKMVCPADGQEVGPDHTVRGFEVGPDQYVVVSDEDLQSVAPEESRSIQILDFVDLDQIDPMYYDRPYYLVPAEQSAKAYRLLLEAMRKSRKVGIAKFVMRTKEYLAALRPLGEAICLETMHFGEEVVPASQIEELPGQVKVDDREVKMAQQLIDSLSTRFNPMKYKDEYQQRVLEMVEKKAEGEEIVHPPPVERPGKVINLMAALEASLAEAKKRKKQPEPKRRKSA